MVLPWCKPVAAASRHAARPLSVFLPLPVAPFALRGSLPAMAFCIG
jgi:hypothetical protein